MNTQFENMDAGEVIARKLAGEASVEELQWLSALCASDDNIAALEKQMESAWAYTANVKYISNIDVNAEWAHFQKSIQTTKTRSLLSYSWVLKIAASVIVIFSALLGYFTFQNTRNIEIAALTSNQFFELPDGSVINLQKGSTLEYSKSFGKQLIREVKLNGTAFFKIKRDTAHPFVINANEAEVKVLGTSFYLSTAPETDNVEVIVIEGKVKLYKRNVEAVGVILEKGEKGIFEKSKNTIIKSSENDVNLLAWHTGKLVYQGERLEKVVQDLSRVYSKPIIISEAIKNCRLTATFENESLDSIIRILKETFQLKITESNGRMLLDGSACK